MNSEQLTGIGVLQGIGEEALSRLAAALEEKEFRDGEAVFVEGDAGDCMYFILSGAVRIEVATESGGSHRKTLAVLEAGDYFGEMSLFDQKPRSASAVASNTTRTLRLSKAAFDQLHQSGSQAGMSVLFAMIRTSSERIRRLSSHLVVYDEIGKAIGESKGLEELLAVVLKQLSGAILADWGLLVLQSQFSRRLEVRAVSHLQLSPPQQEDIGDGNGFLGVAMKDTQGRITANFPQDATLASCPRLGFETASLLWVPISVGQETLGLIVLGGKGVEQFDLNAMNLVRGVAAQTAQAILNARHREEEQARSRHARRFVHF